MPFELTDIEGVMDSFADYLLVKDRPTHDRFQRLRETDREAAIAETMAFRILQHFNCQPELHDHEGTGVRISFAGPSVGYSDPIPPTNLWSRRHRSTPTR